MSASIRPDSHFFAPQKSKHRSEQGWVRSDPAAGFAELFNAELIPRSQAGEEKELPGSFYGVDTGAVAAPPPEFRNIPDIPKGSNSTLPTAVECAPERSESLDSDPCNVSEIQSAQPLELNQDQEQKFPGKVDGPPGKPEQIAEMRVSKPVIPGGILGAKQGLMVLASSQRNADVSGEEEQHSLTLAGFEGASFEQLILPDRLTGISKLRLDYQVNRDLKIPLLDLFRFDPPAGLPLETDETTEVAELRTTRFVELASTVESIRGHVQLLRSTGLEHLQVMLRPDNRTEIFLDVSKVDGAVRVQARCERGDFAWLETHWNTVQQALAAEGVKVEPLQQSSPGQLKLDQGQSDSRRGDQHAGSGEDVELQHSSTKQGSNRSTQNASARTREKDLSGWESWA